MPARTSRSVESGASRKVRSFSVARSYIAFGVICAVTVAGNASSAVAKTTAAGVVSFMIPSSPDLGVHFFEVVLLHQHLARLAAGGPRDQAVGFHHVDEARGTAETNAQPPLQI